MRPKNPLFQEPMRFWLEHWYRVIYDLYILITSSSSFHEFITNEFNDLLPVGLLAQMVERSTGIAEVKGSNPVQAWNFSGFLFATAKVASTITAMKFFDVITLICVGDVRVSIATVFFSFSRSVVLKTARCAGVQFSREGRGEFLNCAKTAVF